MIKKFLYQIGYFFVTKFTRTTKAYVNLNIKFGYIGKDGRPLECPKCSGKEFESKDEIWLNNMLCEYIEVCKCGEVVGEWGYGSWRV